MCVQCVVFGWDQVGSGAPHDPHVGALRGAMPIGLPGVGGIHSHDEIVKSMGGYGELVEDPKDLIPAIERSIKSGLPSLINVLTNPDATSAATHAITAMMTPKE